MYDHYYLYPKHLLPPVPWPGHVIHVKVRHTCILFPFLDRCKRVWSVSVGPRREAVYPWVCECPRLVPLLLPKRLQVAPRWAELWGWVTRGSRGQRLIHRALAADLAGYVVPERNTCDLERRGVFSSRAFGFMQRCLSAHFHLHPWSFRCLPVEWMTSPFPSRRDL